MPDLAALKEAVNDANNPDFLMKNNTTIITTPVVQVLLLQVHCHPHVTVLHNFNCNYVCQSNY